MKTVIQTWQPSIQQQITDIISDFSSEQALYPLDDQQLTYLKKLAIQGKQFRGCLLAGFYSLLRPTSTSQEKKVIARLAAAIEIHGAAILIHDDVIDKSEKRRGMDSVHLFAKNVAQQNQLKSPEHFGISAAICLGDVLFFLADRTVTQLDLPAEIKIKIAAINSEELALLGLAEIEDLRLSSSLNDCTKEEILHMFVGKTGRYTGRWPLELAAVVAGVPEPTIQQISHIGEQLGVLYQLKDDELGIFGDEAIIGKSTTSDLLEGKKTFYYWHLQQLPLPEKKKVFDVVGNQSATLEELNWVKDLLKEKGIKAKVETEILTIKNRVVSEINSLDIPQEAQEFLGEVMEFIVNRNK